MKAVALLLLVAVASVHSDPFGEGAIKEFETTVDNILQFLADIQGKITGGVIAVSKFLFNLESQIKARLANDGKVTLDMASQCLTNVLNLANSNKIISTDSGNKIKATFGINVQGVTALTASDIDTLPIGGDVPAATGFRGTLKNLLQLKDNGIAQVPLIAGVQNGVLDLLVANAIVQVQAALKIKVQLGLAPIQSALDAAYNLFNNLQSQVAGDASAAATFFNNIKADIQAKLEAGGKNTIALLSQVTSHTLDLATSNGVLSKDVAGRIAASFGVGSSTSQPLQFSDVDSLVIGGDETAAAKLKGTLKGLLQLQSTGGADKATLLVGLSGALLTNLAANKVIQISAVVALRNLFGSA